MIFNLCIYNTSAKANSVQWRSIAAHHVISQLPIDITPASTTVEIANNPLISTDIRVSSIQKYGGADGDGAAINDSIIMKIDNFKPYYQQQDEACKKQTPVCTPKFVLTLDGRKITGISPESIAFEKDQGILTFHLQRQPENDEIWADILGSPPFSSSFGEKVVNASLSLDTASEVAPIAPGNKLTLIRFRLWHIVFWSILLAGILFSVIKNIKGDIKNFVRESGPEPADGQYRPYSLGRCQMAWWFLVVVMSYLLIYMTTGNIDTLNNSVLIQLGIGSGTALGAASIDTMSTPSKPQTSKGFWQDLLNNNEQHGPGLHRLQLIIWTVILTVVFIVSVYSRLSMPQFSTVLLALQGIVSGTYLGFKFPENLQPVTSPNSAPATTPPTPNPDK